MLVNKETMKASLTMEEVNKVVLFLNTIDQTKKNKLTYAATQLGEEIESKTKKFKKTIDRLSHEYALKKDDGEFKTNERGNVIIDPKKLIEYTDKVEALTEETTVELELYYCKDKEEISKLPMMHLKTLNGLLFDYDFSELETKQND